MRYLILMLMMGCGGERCVAVMKKAARCYQAEYESEQIQTLLAYCKVNYASKDEQGQKQVVAHHAVMLESTCEQILGLYGNRL